MAITEQLKSLVEQMPNSTMQKKEDRIGKDEIRAARRTASRTSPCIVWSTIRW